MEARVLRGAFAARDAEVKFGIGLLDDFSLQWEQLPDGLKEKWTDLAFVLSSSGLFSPSHHSTCICGGRLVDASTVGRKMVKCMNCGRMA